VCVQLVGFVGGEGTVFVFPEPVAFLKGNPHARAYDWWDVSAFRRRRNLRAETGRRELGNFGKGIQTIE
jgi:hypothetical protein